MANAKSCEELQLIGLSNNTFKIQAGNDLVSTFCAASGNNFPTSLFVIINIKCLKLSIPRSF